ncbi:MAG TPA: FecR domain-containing protein [Chitinophaga sp.]
MEQNARLQYLLDRLATRTATEEELHELGGLVAADPNDLLIDEAEARLQQQDGPALPAYNPAQWMKVADQILAADKLPAATARPPRRTVHFLYRAGWAAAVVLLLGAGAWMLLRPARRAPTPMAAGARVPDVAPGRNGAVLTLADGSQITLDSLGNGVITRQNGTSVVLQHNTLQYLPGAGVTADRVEYNTITTPKGRQYDMVLPDGSKVWLNAGSSLQFPVAFSGQERVVSLTGEGYFEVTKDAAKPFKVKVNKAMEIEVLGTSFNVSAYANEMNSYTTLIDGAVQVSLNAGHGRKVLLKPNQQVQSDGNELKLFAEANVERAVAWKSGLFNFDGVGLRDMMRQLERWYNLEVAYEGDVPDVKFFGEMSRNLQLSDVLSGLERSDVHFRLEAGRRLVVMP